MSAPGTSTPRRRGSTIVKAVAAAAVVVALGFGAAAATKGDSKQTAATGMQQNGGGPPGMGGTQVTGSTLSKLRSVATAKYPGTVERAMKLSDGSYVVQVSRSGGKGQIGVQVSKDFEITGTRAGGPGGGAPPSGSAPSGTAPRSSSSS
jgi:hypothetical protein